MKAKAHKRSILTIRKSTKGSRRPVQMSKELPTTLRHEIEVYMRQEQGQDIGRMKLTSQGVRPH